MPTVPRRLRHRNRRVQEHLVLVQSIARHYALRTAEPLEDLQQVGALGLIRAAELYRSSRQVPFGAFARPHIRGAVLHYLRDVVPLVRVSRRLQERRQQLQRCRETIRLRDGREASRAELQDALGWTSGQWLELQQLALIQRWRPLSDSQDWALDLSGNAEAASEQGGDDQELLLDALKRLEPRQRRVVEAVVLKGESLRAVAARQGSSAATVHRLLHRALASLRGSVNPASGARAC